MRHQFLRGSYGGGGGGGGTPWTPAQPEILFWLDFSDAATIATSGSSVTSAEDKKGGVVMPRSDGGAGIGDIYSGTQSLNGLNVLEVDSPANHRPALFVDNAVPFAAAGGDGAIAFLMRPDDNDNSNADPFGLSTGWQARAGTESGIQWELRGDNVAAGGADYEAQVVAGDQTGLWNIVVIRYEITTGNVEFRLNGSVLVTALGVYQTAISGLHSMAVGANVARVSGFSGLYAEFMTANSPTVGTSELIEGYLADKWGQQALLPGGHPYKTDPPTL